MAFLSMTSVYLICNYCMTFVVIDGIAVSGNLQSKNYIKLNKHPIYGTSLSTNKIRSNLECAVLCMNIYNCSIVMITPIDNEKTMACLSYPEKNPTNVTRISNTDQFDAWYELVKWDIPSVSPTPQTVCPLSYVFIESACLHADN